MPEITERHCRQCGQRCRRGWLRVHEQGEIRAPGANRTTDQETAYCSEKCLRTQLLDAAGNMQLIVDQQREIERLKRNLRGQRDDDDRAEMRVGELRTLLNSLVDQAEPLTDLDPKSAQPGTEEFERLQIAANNMLALLGPHLRRRRSG